MDSVKNIRKSRILLAERKSSSFQRFVARGIDLTVTAIIFFMGKALWWPLGWVGAVFYASVQDFLGEGQSIGKKIIGLQVIDDYSGLPCSVINSALRNAPFVMTVFCMPFSVVAVLSQFFLLPIFILELYLLFTLDSGVRLGDVMGNTSVVEHFQDEIDLMSQP